METKFICDNCGKEFINYKCNRRLKHIFCSRKCYHISLVGKKRDKKVCKNISNYLKKAHKDGLRKDIYKTISKSKKGVPRSEDTKLKLRVSMLQQHQDGRVAYWKGKKIPREFVEKSKKSLKIFYKENPEIIKEAHRKRVITIKNDPEKYDKLKKHLSFYAEKYKEKRIKNSIKGLMKRPTSFEKKIAVLCVENNLPFVYTGDGRFLVNYKNPDFVDKENKIAIEVFYSWFKIRDYGSVEKYKEFCIKRYNPFGWRVIFIDENEVNVDNWKELCLNKINYIQNDR